MKNKIFTKSKKSDYLFLIIIIVIICECNIISATIATGGSITYVGEYTTHTFTSNGTFTVTSGGNVEVLVVAGGGSGGGSTAGGGGAGGLIYNSSYLVNAGSINVTVGHGGAQAAQQTSGNSGQNSTFGTLVAIGGGGGGFTSAATSGGPGLNGGSGGGGARYGAKINSNGTGIPGQGNDGGIYGTDTYPGGGGGGAGAVGSAPTGSKSGNGGAGLNYSINGSNVYYAGGGGGGSQTSGGDGGLGGGGAGTSNGRAGTAGTANTGGGGGGGWLYSGGSGGAGGSGIVIIRYLTDVTPPFITLNSPENNLNTSSTNIDFNFTATDETSTILNCSLHIDNVYKNNNGTTLNNTATFLNASGLAGGSHNWTINCSDASRNSNVSTRTFTVDISPPNITSIAYSPNSTDDVDPGTSVTFNATVSDAWIGVDTVILQYHNGTGWTNSTMTNNTNTNYNTTITTLSAESNYTFNIWANDSLGNSNHSVNQTFVSAWDCTWSATSALGQAAGFDENKWAGNLTINNTGDSEYSNGCAPSFHLTHSLSRGRIYFNNWPNNQFLTYYDTPTISAKTSSIVWINASFQDEVLEESVTITTADLGSITETSSATTSLTLVSTTGGPYLFQTITSNPTTLDLKVQNFSLSSYIRNLVGDDTVNNTAYNVSFNWTLPSNFLVKDGNASLLYGNLSDNLLNYNNLNITFNATNLPSLSPGTVSINLYAQGFNSSGTVITHAGNITLLTKQINITLSCYLPSDGVYVTACGELDGDYVEPTIAAAGAAGGGGGGGGGGGTIKTESVKTNAGFQLVRGKENEVEVAFENQDKNESITDIEFSTEGDIAKYIEIFPKTFSILAPGQEVTVTLKITSPTYIELGRQELTITMKGKKGDKDYINKKTVVLEIHELSGEEAENLLKESEQLIKQYNEQRYCGEILCSPSLLPEIQDLQNLLEKSKESIEEFGYETVRDNYEIIEKTVTNALKAKEIIEELTALILVSNEKGIDTSGSERILKLVILSLERGDFEQAYLRAKEAQQTYALEVKGELASIGYYLSHNKKEISLSSVFLLLFSFVTYKVSKLQSLKRKIKNLREEENILAELMKVVQNETFKEGRMSMDEYREAMDQYEDRLSKTIEKLIELETKRAYALKFTSKQKKLKIERERVIELVKGLQKSYLQEGTMETRSYELRLKSYNKRLSEIDQMFATLEAKSAMKDGAGLFGEGDEVKVEVKDRGSGLIKRRNKLKKKKKGGRNGK